MSFTNLVLVERENEKECLLQGMARNVNFKRNKEIKERIERKSFENKPLHSN